MPDANNLDQRLEALVKSTESLKETSEALKQTSEFLMNSTETLHNDAQQLFAVTQEHTRQIELASQNIAALDANVLRLTDVSLQLAAILQNHENRIGGLENGIA